MRKINIKILLMICVISIITIFIPHNVEAAGSFSISRSSASLNPGGTTTITIAASNCAGQFTITTSNSSVAAVSTSSIWLDNSSSTVTITAKGAGTATISITASDVTDTDLNTVSGTRACAITVTNPAPVTPPSSSGNSSGGGTTTNKPTTNNSGATNNKPSNNNNSSSNTGTTTTKPEEKKSNDASLKGLIVEGYDLYPEFNTSTKEYNLKVTNDITTVNIVPAVNHEKASYKIEGLPEELQVGANVVKVIVTAEDGTTNTYVVTVNRGRENLKLQNLNVSYIDEMGNTKQLQLKPALTEGVYEYTLGDISYLVSKLNVEVLANLEQAKIEITGKDELTEGENTIIITITMPSESEEEEDEVLTYKITVNKEKEPVITLMGRIQNWYGDNQYKVIMGALMLCSATMGGLSVYLIMEYKKYRLLIQKVAEITRLNNASARATETETNIQTEQTITEEINQTQEEKIKPKGRHF